MPEETLNPIEQRLTLVIQDKIVGDAAAKHLAKVTQAFTRTQKSIQQYEKHFQRHSKSIKAALPNVDRYREQQMKLGKTVNASLAPMRKQADLLRRNRREMSDTVRVGQKLNRVYSSFGKIAAAVGVGSLFGIALNETQKLAMARMQLMISGGQQAVGTAGANRFSADLVSSFLKQSSFARFGIGNNASKSLLAIQKALSGVGATAANNLILQVTKDLENSKLRQVLDTAAGGNVRRALLMSANQQNIGAVSDALNAFDFTRDMQTQPEKVDPLLKQASDIITGMDAAVVKFDDTVSNLAAWFAKLSTGQQIGVGVGGVVGTLTAWEVGKYAIGRGVRSIFGRGIPGVPPGVPGSPVGAPPGFPVWNIPGTRPMLPAPSLRTIPRPFSWGMPVTGGVLGYGLPAAAAAGSIYTAGKSYQTRQAKLDALEAIEKSMGDRRLFSVAALNKSNANTELEKLIAKRQEISAMLLSNSQSDVGQKGWLGRTLGFYADAPEVNQRQTEKLRALYADIQKRIQDLKKVETTGENSRWTDWIREGLEKAKDAASKFKTGFDDLVQKGLEANVKRLQQQAARMQQLELTATEQSALTQLSRLDFDIARTTPFGTVGAFGEWRDLQVQLNREIESLTDVMKNIDQSTQQGRIEAARLNAQVKSLRLEERQRQLEMTRALLDGVISQAFNAGKFSKIIFTQDQNLRAGLQIGAVRPFPQITGSLTPSGRKPVRLNPATNAVDATKNLAKAANDLVGYLEEIIGEDESDYPMRPGASGFSSLN